MIYLDYQSTTPIDKRVLKKMQETGDMWGNPHSNSHSPGLKSAKLVEEARGEVASLINARPKDIIFTSGATEANNLAIKGYALFNDPSKSKHIITTQTEHKCVIESCRFLEGQGYKVTYLKPKPNGIIDLQDLENAITDETIMISIIHLNNEIGTIQNLKDIGALTRKHNIIFHTDAAQSYGKLPIDVEECNIDLMSISGHKFYGPKGIGALYVRTRPRRIRLQPLMHGGGQERGLRSGTLPLPLVCGLGEAAKIASQEMQANYEYITKLGKYMADSLLQDPHVVLNGDAEQRFYGNLNLSFACIEGESFMMSMPEMSMSSGSACTSQTLATSYVLKAIDVPDSLAHTSIRFGIGKFTTKEEIDYAIDKIKSTVVKLREMSPLWEMQQKGIDINTIEWNEH